MNASLAWKMFERRDFVDTSATFKFLEKYQYALNRIQSNSAFMVYALLELLSHAKALRNNILARYDDYKITVADGNILKHKAGGTSRRRLELVNFEYRVF